MEKLKNAFQCIVVTVLFWVIAKIVPGIVESMFQGSIVAYMAARFALIFAAWKMSVSIFGGKHWECALWNFYAVIFIEGLSVLNLIPEMYIYGSANIWLYAAILILEAAYIGFCIYLAKKIKAPEKTDEPKTEEDASTKKRKAQESMKNFFGIVKVSLCYWAAILIGPSLVILWNNFSYFMTGLGYGSGSFMYKVLSFAAQPLSCLLASSLADSAGNGKHKKCVLINCTVATFALLILAYIDGKSGNKERAINMVVSACACVAMMFLFLKQVPETAENKG